MSVTEGQRRELARIVEEGRRDGKTSLQRGLVAQGLVTAALDVTALGRKAYSVDVVPCEIGGCEAPTAFLCAECSRAACKAHRIGPLYCSTHAKPPLRMRRIRKPLGRRSA